MTKNQKSSLWIALIVVVGILCLVTIIAVPVTQYAKTSWVTLSIDDKESVSSGDGHEYRVYTDKGTFKVGDSLVHLRFNAADVYGKIQKGQTYQCKVYGWRIPLLSGFKNILECKK